MAAPRSSRVTRSSVGLNGLDEKFYGRTLRNRSIAQPDETSSPPAPRARLPSKKQESQQAGTPSGKVADGEPSPGHRKRVLSVSDRDEPERSDVCERIQVVDAAPPLKKSKRCSRAGECRATGDEPPPSSDAARVNDEDSKTDSGSEPPLGKLGDEGKRDAKAGTASNMPAGATNGLDDTHKDDFESAAVEPCACPLPSAPSLPNGTQVAPSTPDPIVPCSLLKQAGGSRVDGERNPADAVLPLEPEVEFEVDVVGDSGQDQDERLAKESANGGLLVDPLDPSDDCSNISGETAGLSSSRPPAEPPSFTEPQEHRYALRTSPRRTSCVTGPRSSSPHGGNGPLLGEATATPLGLGDALCRDEPQSPDWEASRGFSEHPGIEVGTDAVLSPSKVSGSTKEPTVRPAEEDEVEDEDPDVYYFESDHLALKHNKDYQRLLQTIGVLEAQRTQAILDLETLARHQKQALTNPVAFVDQLQKQMDLGLPCPQRVVQLPDVVWDQYTSGRGDFERELCDKKRKTRQLQLIFDKVGVAARPKSPVDSKREADGCGLYSPLPSSDAPEHGASSNPAQMIRGRPYHQNKPDTFNQLWTVEEQKKLEQLLLKFPPEEVESKRWQKIADELGNRTAKQVPSKPFKVFYCVASRVQKYFIKLTKAGIPVPGRTPNLCMHNRKASNKRQHHLNKHLYRPSTFLTSYEPPVYMEDEDEHSSFIGSLQDGAAHDSDEDSLPMELRHLPEFKELQELKRLRKQRIQELQSESSLAQHGGYKCDVCGMEPIQGVRWHCQDCPQDNAVDLCASCVDCSYKTDTHTSNHRLEPAPPVADNFLDRDYCLPQSAAYNYLDPNYFPANR